jgi:hypothetical protein
VLFSSSEIRIPLNESFNSISNLQFKYVGSSTLPVVAIVNRLHLFADETNLANSQTMYCSGQFREWVSNLDGPNGPIGFWNERSNINNLFEQYAPYKQICDLTPAHSWTGSACCGNNPEGSGEFYVDVDGMCWNSTPVRNNNIVHEQVRAVDDSLLAKSLLYSNGKIYGCNVDETQLNFSMQFGEGVKDDDLKFNDVSLFENFDEFESKFRFVCVPGEGWMEISQTNRMLLLAAHMLNLASENEFTLYCGNIENISNNFNVEGLASRLTDRGCILRTQTSGTNYKTYLGVELTNLNTNIVDYAELLSKEFLPFSDNQDVVCDPQGEKLYASCSDLENVELYVSRSLNLALLSDTVIRNEKLVEVTGFTRLMNWFRQLLNMGSPSTTRLMFDLTTDTNDIFITKKDNAQVIGIIRNKGDSNSQETLINITGMTPDDATISLLGLVDYLNENEYSLTTNNGVTELVVYDSRFDNWKKATAILRIE